MAKSHPPVKKINDGSNKDNKAENIMQDPAAREKNEQIDVCANGFIRVQRKRNRIEKFFLPELTRTLRIRTPYPIWRNGR